MTPGQHPSDDPGRPGDLVDPERTGRYQHSGPNSPSLPRRTGSGERQAPRVQYTGEQADAELTLIPGQVLYGDGPVVINAGRDVVTLTVQNTAARPMQVGSHYHFAEDRKSVV